MKICLAENRFAVQDGAAAVQPTSAGRQVWMVSFADLMAILLTFMVVAFSTKEMAPTSWQNVSQSMQDAFEREAGPVAHKRAPDLRNVIRLIEDSFPALAEAGGVVATPAGVELDLAGISVNAEDLAGLAGILNVADRSLVVRVIAPLTEEKPTSVQRLLAWEKGLTEAFDLRAMLMAEGVARQPRISVSVAEEQAAGAVLLIESEGGEGS